MMRIWTLAFIFSLSQVYAEPVILCDSSKGLELIEQENYSQAQIDMILAGCDKVTPHDPQVLLLHGLSARRKAQQTKNYLPAIEWLEKANQIAPDNLTIQQELALTYELANHLSKALAIYQLMLAKDPTTRAALLGTARIYRIQGQYNQAIAIYQGLLATAPHDIDALNGLAWVKAAQKDLIAASNLFHESLKIRPENPDALLGLNAIGQTAAQSEVAQQQCNTSKGFILVHKTPLPVEEIKAILKHCEANKIDTSETQLLHGLLARQQALTSGRFEEAISWLQKAMNSAAPQNKSPALELAVTYEWAKQLAKSKAIYEYILAYEPSNRAAMLGKGRVLRLEGAYGQASALYQQLLQKNKQDVDAINGLGWIALSEKNVAKAKEYFTQTLKIQSTNKDAVIALNQIRAIELTPQVSILPCPLNKGLQLISQKNPSVAEIESILQQCEKANFQNTEVELLRGLLARYQADKTKHYEQAIFWLQKAMQSAPPENKAPALELALTYERANQLKKANLIYQQVLSQEPGNKGALLGKARILRANNQLPQAQLIYQQLLAKNAHDFDALNGMGWIELKKNNLAKALQFFRSSLAIQPSNEEAQIAIQKINYLKAHPPVASAKSLCDANMGLILLNQAKPDFAQINKILQRCDNNMPTDTATLMLHALLARYVARHSTLNYQEAISWFQLAVQSAALDNKMPLFELAVTYEWAEQPKKALSIYHQLLFAKPDDTPALLGQARVLRTLYLISASEATYGLILKKNPRNIEALIGLGETKLVNYELGAAKAIFQEALTLAPHHEQIYKDLRVLDNTTRNIFAMTRGRYTVPPASSDGTNFFYFRNINATDSLTLYSTHNTKQIESGFSFGPTLLPNNSLLIGYQHLIPNKYGVQVSYDARQHKHLPFEHRAYGFTNLFLTKRLQVFNAVRFSFPEPWNTKLLISGATVYTPLPFDITFTGFWAYQQIGGKSESYALDFSREFSNRLFYDIGPSYLPREKSWEIHGRLILPTFKNQALVAEYSHYFFNRSTFAIAGWRFYWA